MKRLPLFIVGIFILFFSLAAFLLHMQARIPLGPHLGATHSLVTQFKSALIVTSIKINFLFFILTAVAVMILCISYSHRVAGPLVKVKGYAALLGEGKFDTPIQFRKSDEIHALSDALNQLAEKYREQSEQAERHLRAIEAGLQSWSAHVGSEKDNESLKSSRLDMTARIRNIIKQIRI